MNCPGCKEEMVEQSFEGLQGNRVALDVCHACHGLWFDTNESRRLSSSGTLHLFREVRGRRGERRHRVARSLACARCGSALTPTHDLAHNNRFQYSADEQPEDARLSQSRPRRQRHRRRGAAAAAGLG